MRRCVSLRNGSTRESCGDEHFCITCDTSVQNYTRACSRTYTQMRAHNPEAEKAPWVVPVSNAWF